MYYNFFFLWLTITLFCSCSCASHVHMIAMYEPQGTSRGFQQDPSNVPEVPVSNYLLHLSWKLSWKRNPFVKFSVLASAIMFVNELNQSWEGCQFNRNSSTDFIVCSRWMLLQGPRAHLWRSSSQHTKPQTGSSTSPKVSPLLMYFW